jgi:hypothetical protein
VKASRELPYNGAAQAKPKVTPYLAAGKENSNVYYLPTVGTLMTLQSCKRIYGIVRELHNDSQLTIARCCAIAQTAFRTHRMLQLL